MAFRLALALEIMALIVCIHRLYDKKVKFDIGTILLYLGCLIIFNVVNVYGFSSFYTIVAYVLMGGYCIRRYKDSVVGASLSMFLGLIIIVIMQFLCALPMDIFFQLEESKRAIITNFMVLGGSVWLLPRCKLYALRKTINRYNRFILVFFSFILCVIFLMQLQERMFGELHSDLFVLVIPLIVMLLISIGKWGMIQHEKQIMEHELRITISMQEKYEELLKNVRMRQHEFRNHLSAILSTHYTHRSYDKLVKAQKEYYGKLAQENKYSNLLILKDSVLAGFLYSKFQEMEAEGIKVKCKLTGGCQQIRISEFYLVEMLGILLDNAAQTVQNKELLQMVNFAFIEEADRFLFSVSNRFPYISYEEIEKWFQMGNSTKGEGRGMGLYHMKCLCEELGCHILCQNTAIEGENWIEFILIVSKADMK